MHQTSLFKLHSSPHQFISVSGINQYGDTLQKCILLRFKNRNDVVLYLNVMKCIY